MAPNDYYDDEDDDLEEEEEEEEEEEVVVTKKRTKKWKVCKGSTVGRLQKIGQHGSSRNRGIGGILALTRLLSASRIPTSRSVLSRHSSCTRSPTVPV